jgi:hypothetical protein
MIWKCINIVAAFLLILPGIVLLAMRVYNKDDVSIMIASDYCNSIESKTVGLRKPSIALITLRADEFVSHGQGKVAFPVIFKVKS